MKECNINNLLINKILDEIKQLNCWVVENTIHKTEKEIYVYFFNY